MQTIILIFFLMFGYFIIQDARKDKTHAGGQRMVMKHHRNPAQPFGMLPGTSAPRGFSSADDLISQVSSWSGVPAGLLYGIWQKESAGLIYGWHKNWELSSGMRAPGSRCWKKRGAKCITDWNALVAICSQRRRNGSVVCDPRVVKGSWAMALGPTQHMASEVHRWFLAPARPGFPSPADFDGDGVVDPFSLPDAMAMTAIQLRVYYVQKGSWRGAANRYYGSGSDGYFEGKFRRPGVLQHWEHWCKSRGCSATPVLVASR